jgi:hypothetical protein
MTLSAIEGRLKSLCVAEGGRLVTHREVDDALARVDDLQQYRLVQETLETIRVDVIGEDDHGKRVARDAAEILQGLFGQNVNVAVSEVSELLPEKSGKFLLATRDFPLDLCAATPKTEKLHG